MDLDNIQDIKNLEKDKSMKKYRIWVTKEKYIDVTAPCPSEAIKVASTRGIRWYWTLERLDD